ncbi:MAG: hypothetical protein PWP09_1697, partial [Thermotogota bacterium]|nr:hypothetical protein [Thermotogota bacterium]
EAEESTSGGRSDIVVKTKDKVYVIELKMDRPAREAIEQVKERGYAQKYKDAKIVAISIDSKQKKITEWVEV